MPHVANPVDLTHNNPTIALWHMSSGIMKAQLWFSRSNGHMDTSNIRTCTPAQYSLSDVITKFPGQLIVLGVSALASIEAHLLKRLIDAQLDNIPSSTIPEVGRKVDPTILSPRSRHAWRIDLFAACCRQSRQYTEKVRPDPLSPSIGAYERIVQSSVLDHYACILYWINGTIQRFPVPARTTSNGTSAQELKIPHWKSIPEECLAIVKLMCHAGQNKEAHETVHIPQ
ncbi:hypothetical protein BS47DRAFT_1369236 [Hydnum rufescens UP504]|uniref:Uncharacterized protein n=1 Tax=Hydnum rufescens UP504 TaxID=1448309 RepID=A0A9P6ADC1_9AGAM|nr:hypothetical protein BS47DRAFT_1369236 [Hydnum rufescens UP504]